MIELLVYGYFSLDVDCFLSNEWFISFELKISYTGNLTKLNCHLDSRLGLG